MLAQNHLLYGFDALLAIGNSLNACHMLDINAAEPGSNARP